MAQRQRPYLMPLGEDFNPDGAQAPVSVGLPATAAPARVNVRPVTMTPDQMQRQVTDKLRAETFAQQRANGVDEKTAHRAAYIAANRTGADLAAQDYGYGANYNLNRGFMTDANTRANDMNMANVGLADSAAGVNRSQAGAIDAGARQTDAVTGQVIPAEVNRINAGTDATKSATYGQNLSNIRFGLETPFHLAGLGLQNKAAGYQVGAMPGMLAAQQSAAELGNLAAKQNIDNAPAIAAYKAGQEQLAKQLDFLGKVGGLMNQRFMAMNDGGTPADDQQGSFWAPFLPPKQAVAPGIPAQTQPQSTAPAPSDLPVIRNAQERDKLPPGAKYIYDNGQGGRWTLTKEGGQAPAEKPAATAKPSGKAPAAPAAVAPPPSMPAAQAQDGGWLSSGSVGMAGRGLFGVSPFMSQEPVRRRVF